MTGSLDEELVGVWCLDEPTRMTVCETFGDRCGH